MKVSKIGSRAIHIAAEDCATRSASHFGAPFETPMVRDVVCLCGATLRNATHRVVVMVPGTEANCLQCAREATRAVLAARSARN